MEGNLLAGSIPAGMAELGSLEELWLRSNRLSGTVPRGVLELPKLSHLWLSQNDIVVTGEVLEACRRLNALKNDGMIAHCAVDREERGESRAPLAPMTSGYGNTLGVCVATAAGFVAAALLLKRRCSAITAAALLDQLSTARTCDEVREASGAKVLVLILCCRVLLR